MSGKFGFPLVPLIKALRPGQWIKNLLIFAAIIFNGRLFDPIYFTRSVEAFFVFSFLSSASYLLNDIIDEPFDKQHPEKKNRPVASGALPKHTAFEVMIFLSILGLAGAFILGFGFFLISGGFLLLHVLYTFYFKKFAILDILAIALSFTLRALAGEILTGLHLPIWLMYTVIFLSLFIAASKRRSELVYKGTKARPTLIQYREKLLDFYVSTFATATIVTYSLFTFIEGTPKFTGGLISPLLSEFVPQLVARKWLMVTIPFVIVGIMRYAQLIFQQQMGEQPEKLVTSDIPLVATILGWGATIVFILYIL